jgi:hypothetical protein
LKEKEYKLKLENEKNNLLLMENKYELSQIDL